MDINCIDPCFYQTDGKCTLRELPSYTQTLNSGAYDMDCPYFINTAYNTYS